MWLCKVVRLSVVFLWGMQNRNCVFQKQQSLIASLYLFLCSKFRTIFTRWTNEISTQHYMEMRGRLHVAAALPPQERVPSELGGPQLVWTWTSAGGSNPVRLVSLLPDSLARESQCNIMKERMFSWVSIGLKQHGKWWKKIMRTFVPYGSRNVSQSVLFQEHTHVCVSTAKLDSPTRKIVKQYVLLSFGFYSTEDKQPGNSGGTPSRSPWKVKKTLQAFNYRFKCFFINFKSFFPFQFLP